MQTITFTTHYDAYNVTATPASVHHHLAASVAEARPTTRRRRKLVLRRARAWRRLHEESLLDRELSVSEPAGDVAADMRHEEDCSRAAELALRCLDGLTLNELAWAGRAIGTPRWYGGREYPVLQATHERAYHETERAQMVKIYGEEKALAMLGLEPT